jgi:hypothetical protein
VSSNCFRNEDLAPFISVDIRTTKVVSGFDKINLGIKLDEKNRVNP